MQRLPAPFKVYVGLVPMGYLNPEAIERVVRDGMFFCGTPKILERQNGGAVLVSPDVTMADGKAARHAYTHPEVVRAVLHQTFEINPRVQATIMARAFHGLPASRMLRRANGTSEVFRQRGYYEFEQLFPGKVELAPADDCEFLRYQLSKGAVLSGREKTRLLESDMVCGKSARAIDRLNNEILAPREYQNSDFTIYCPKLKSSVLSQGFSGAIRLGDPTRRAIFADLHLCDMLEICNPQLVVSDGIIAAVGGNEMTQRGHELGVILVSNNALAHDLIAAQVFNLDPMKIDHLRIAAERGWGPSNPSQIERGGAGIEGIRQLSQKTRFWDLGFIPLGEFGAKFERENPGHAFPLEIISGAPYESSGAHGLVLDWLYLTYDFPRRRASIARWPRASVCVGDVTEYPTHYLVYAAGDRACAALQRMTSSSRKLFGFGSKNSRVHFSVELVQLKDGRRHAVVKISGSPPRLRGIFLAFFVGSLGRMGARSLTLTLLADRVFFTLRRWLRPPRNPLKARIAMTSRLPQNSWWSLKRNRPVTERAAVADRPELR
ncbi:MAG: DUF362 domain-containing protein [Deltaproteobacteria bacterium]|nr:DUF362 domain-containing protein [Deltaproteobacteria bacterium]